MKMFDKIFTTTFVVVEMRGRDLMVTHRLRGPKKEVMKDVEQFKGIAVHGYEMIGNKGMVVWA